MKIRHVRKEGMDDIKSLSKTRSKDLLKSYETQVRPIYILIHTLLILRMIFTTFLLSTKTNNKQLQTITDSHTKKIDQMLSAKEKEILAN